MPAVIKILEARERPYADLITRVYPVGETGRAFADWDATPGNFTKILVALTA